MQTIIHNLVLEYYAQMMSTTYIFLFAFSLCFGQNLKQAGFPEKIEDESNQVICSSTDIPTWLDGYLFRQVCGGVGRSESPVGQHLTNFMDCMAMVVSYKFKDGNVYFSNKYFDTKQYNIWKENNKDMTLSKVAWQTDYSDIDLTAYNKNEPRYPKKPNLNPNMGFWRIGNRIEGVAEVQKGFEFDASNLNMKGYFKFDDNNMGLSEKHIFINNVADALHDKDGNVWSSVIAFESTNAQDTTYDVHRIVYKVDKQTAKREVVANRVTSNNVDISDKKCIQRAGKLIYDDTNFKEGYMHSIAMTENYIILPITSYYLNPCLLRAIKDKKNVEPTLKTWYSWDSKTPSKFIVVRKKDGVFVRTFSLTEQTSQGPGLATPVFVMHTINAYEDENDIYLDLLTYSNALTYQRYFGLSTLLNEKDSWPTEATPYRYKLNLNTGSWSLEKLTPEANSAVAVEFPNINPAFLGKPYRFSYMWQNPYSDGSLITKFDFKTKTTNLAFHPTSQSIYLSEPIFVQEPGKTGEDEGILLVPGFNATSRKGLVMVVNAKDMSLIGQTIAPKFTPFGFHNKFYTRTELGISGSQTIIFSTFLFVISLFITHNYFLY